MGRAIAVAVPFFFVLIALEWGWARARGFAAYRLNDAVNSLSIGVMSQVAGVFLRVLNYGIYAAVFSHVALGAWPRDAWWAWALAIVFYDFCYYWAHRLGHVSAVFWAAHVVHHQSQCYNLSTALRQTSSGALLGWIFFLPMAVAGVTPEMFAVAAIVDLLYQYWIHTELVGRLGWFDRWFASPSNHRVHHAVNDSYVDRNYGGIFMAWDRLFGSFVEEDEPCVYGTRSPLNSWDPLWANVEVYAELARKSWHTPGLLDKARVWLMPPGWQPASDRGTPWQPPKFDVTSVRRYDPPLSRAAGAFALLHLVAAVAGTLPLLWYSDTLAPSTLVAGACAVLLVLWLTGAVMQGRLRLPSALLLELGVVAVVWTGIATAEERGHAPPAVVDDPRVQRAVESARAEFLAGQPFDRFQVTVLLDATDGRWLRGSVDGDALAYPASCVKLAYLVGAVHWCAEHGRAPDCLDLQVRPMIVESDNVATGFVVDAISGAVNGPVEGADVEAWIERRRYTERVLEQAGLLGGQRLFTKTYPTNSGEEPADLEKLAWQRLGRNAMSADLAARLMLAIQSGTLEPQATAYMRSLLRRPTFSPHSALGAGLPPGTLYENKIGVAFDTLEDIVYAQLPNGRRLIIAAFSNGLDEHDAEPWDVTRLGRFTELLLDRLGLRGGMPTSLYVNARGGESPRWTWAVPADGRYEIAIWYPALDGDASAVDYVVHHAAGVSRVRLDQTMWGSRWIKLGDFEMRRGEGEVSLEAAGPGRLTAGPVRITRWPAQTR
jgi:sterol desaturase/sphingolipid hydroxylase (fatty acid hydroxylase superfamily)